MSEHGCETTYWISIQTEYFLQSHSFTGTWVLIQFIEPNYTATREVILDCDQTIPRCLVDIHVKISEGNNGLRVSHRYSRTHTDASPLITSYFFR